MRAAAPDRHRLARCPKLFELRILLGILSAAFWPTPLVLVDVLAFQTPKPEPILLSFLVGGLISTVTIGT